MNPRLQAEYRRLFCLSDERVEPDLAGLSWVDAVGNVRTLVFGLRLPADWTVLSALWRGVQSDLEWPAPAIAVNGSDAFELWFSLKVPMPRADAVELLAQLRHSYLGNVRADRLLTWPNADATVEPPACPPFEAGPDRWAAFVAPDLPAVFGDDPALDFEPGAEAQAELLSRLQPISPAELHAAQATFAVSAPQASAPHELVVTGSSLASSVTGDFQEPRAFLLAVMNDPGVSLALRIEAAKGLLQAPVH